ncbi:flavin-containing monooxygenase [Salix suchowensis]|nr:flavin-containing monooxygenase [Salix suchowensis]
MACEKSHIQCSSKVGIIGAGISGIAAAKQLRHYSPLVFEATDSIGGVWKHCSFSSTKLQTPRCDFEFSDYPCIGILEYYAAHFDVLKYVKFSSKVVEIRYVGGRKTTQLDLKPEEYGSLLNGYPAWEVAVETSQSTKVEWYAFEFLVVCVGKYGDVPRMPVFPPRRGEEEFLGEVLHAMDYAKLDEDAARELLKGKKVAVVGYKKSAIDLAVECAAANQGPEGQPCTMVIRTLHWTVPSYSIWGLPFFLFFSTRSSQFLHERPHQTMFKTLLCLLLSPMRRGISKFIESYLAWKLPLVKYGLKPDHPFVEDYASCQMAICLIISLKRLTREIYCSKEHQNDKTKLEADVVVLATGYDGKKKLQDLLPEPFSSLAVDSTGIMPLYRGTIHPLIPSMAFVGYIESVSNLHTAELRCIWLARLADEKFKLPSIEKMLEQTNEEIQVMKRTTRFYKRHCISTYSINHSDDICEEMGWNSWRKKNWFSEAFSAYNSQDYEEKKEN